MRFGKFLALLPAIACIAIGCESREVEETVWDDQIKTLDKARDVEQKLMDRAGRLGDELDPEDKKKEPPE